MDKLNRVKKILSAELGTKIPLQRPSWVTSDYKYVKNNGSLSIYSKDGKEWYKDLINNPTVYYGPLEGFNDVDLNSQPISSTNTDSSLNGTKPVTTVLGAAPVGPNSAVEAAASQNQKVGEEVKALQIKEQAVSQVSQLEPPKIEVKGLNTSPDALKEVSKGMNQVSDQRNGEYQEREQEREQEEKEKKEKRDAIIGNISTGVTASFQGIGTAFGAQQAATDSNTTKTANQLYNTATDAVEKMGPVGKVVGTALKNAAIAGDIIQGLGGGTDQMTTTDKWMDSSFFSWNIGMINGFGGKKADIFAADKNVLESVGSSYGGTSAEIMDAASKSGKKYGAFSSSARRRANRAMAAARAKQNIMADISDEATDQRLAVQSMGEQAGLAYSMMTDGGYNQKYTYAAKHGGTLEWNPEITLEWEPQIELNWELPAFKEGGQISEELEWVPELQEGGKTRTLEELIAYAKEQNPRFIQRLSESPHGIEFIDDEGNKGIGNVYLEWGTDNKGNAVIYPRIQEMDDKSLKFLSSDEAWERANKNNNILIMSPEEAQIFFAEDPEYQTAYKRGWPKMFKNYSEKAALQNNINLDIIHDYYKNHDLSGVEFIIDESPRTEGKKLYIRNEEDAVHELWHLLSQNKPNEKYIKFYDNLNDDRIIELGGDLKFVKRFEGDPGHFYHPSELEARIKAAKFKTQGQTYTKEFFQNLRKDENKYGDNMRDLLHMYNDENLEEIFNLKKGGALGEKLETPEIEETNQKNVIPEGALHKNKHHMEHAEGLTKKGIPVIDEEGEQQAEIELNEIIFTLEVTKKLEEYYEIFYSEDSTNKEKEQAALEAGKLLVYEILENTDDRTGLIESCKKGGSITLKKSTDDLIEETLEWIPNIIVIEETIEKAIEEKSKKEKSEKEQMKEAIKEVLIELLTK